MYCFGPSALSLNPGWPVARSGPALAPGEQELSCLGTMTGLCGETGPGPETDPGATGKPLALVPRQGPSGTRAVPISGDSSPRWGQCSGLSQGSGRAGCQARAQA